MESRVNEERERGVFAIEVESDAVERTGRAARGKHHRGCELAWIQPLFRAAIYCT